MNHKVNKDSFKDIAAIIMHDHCSASPERKQSFKDPDDGCRAISRHPCDDQAELVDGVESILVSIPLLYGATRHGALMVPQQQQSPECSVS
eukprot:2046581-Amphidinium_carterae.1